MIQGAGPWGTGPYKLVEGFSLPDKRTDQVILEANLEYWDKTRLPRLQRIIFDNTLAQHDAVELVKTGEGRVDLVSELSPLETLRVAESPFAKVVKNRGNWGTLFGFFNMRKVGIPWRDVRLRQAVNVWRLDLRVAIAADCITQVVRDDEQDVQLVRGQRDGGSCQQQRERKDA